MALGPGVALVVGVGASCQRNGCRRVRRKKFCYSYACGRAAPLTLQRPTVTKASESHPPHIRIRTPGCQRWTETWRTDGGMRCQAVLTSTQTLSFSTLTTTRWHQMYFCSGSIRQHGNSQGWSVLGQERIVKTPFEHS